MIEIITLMITCFFVGLFFIDSGRRWDTGKYVSVGFILLRTLGNWVMFSLAIGFLYLFILMLIELIGTLI